MTQPNTHIVYQNRLQHDFYESGLMFPLIGGLAAFFLAFLAIVWVAQKAARKFRKPDHWVTGAAGFGAAVIGALVFNYLMI